MSDATTSHGTNQTGGDVAEVDWTVYTQQDYDGGVREIRVCEVTHLGHTARGFTKAEAFRRLADRLDGESGLLDVGTSNVGPIGGDG